MSDKLDLTAKAPRSPRVRLGGFVILPRMLDKARATLTNSNGEYNFNCTLDQYFLSFVGIEPEGILAQLKSGKGDGEILSYILENSKFKRLPNEIITWSNYHESRAPSNVEGRQYFHELHQKVAPNRADISTWFDLLDVDDYISFGGKA